MTVKQAVEYWFKSAQEDLKTATSLIHSKRYAHCLFFCHLFIEKILKALIVKNIKDNPLPIHNLVRLAGQTGIVFTEQQKAFLTEVNEFNLRARYDDVKFRFHKKATKKFTEKYFKQSKGLYLWLEKKL